MKRWLSGLGVLSALGLVGLGALEWGARVDPVAHDRFGRDIRLLSALDARLDGQVMQSRQALVAHYDDIGRTMGALDAAHTRLANLPGFVRPKERAEVTGLLARSREAMSQKEASIERFKSENAILRNSVGYFPVVAVELRDRLTEQGNPAAASAVDAALIAVLRFNQRPGSAEDRDRAQDAIDALSVEPMSNGLDRDADVVIRHARTVLEHGVSVAELTNGILDAPTAQRDLALDTAYARAFQRAIRDGERRRFGMFGLALAALGFLGVDIILRLRKSAASERAANERLEQANKALFGEKERERELGELKSRFVSMTSHEFRTPLSVILSSAELLEAYGERWTPAKKSDHYARIKSAIFGMTVLLDSILIIGKSEAGKLDFSPAPLDVARYARHLMETLQPTMGDKHSLISEIDGDFEGAWADEKLLNHILMNLLSNAVKYSPKGGAVTFQLRRDGEAAVFIVSDEGIGIPAPDLQRLFESFHRGANVGHIPGTGLGLAVVKRSVDAHGGELEVDTETAKGTTFRVVIPIAAPVGEPASLESAAE